MQSTNIQDSHPNLPSSTKNCSAGFINSQNTFNSFFPKNHWTLQKRGVWLCITQGSGISKPPGTWDPMILGVQHVSSAFFLVELFLLVVVFSNKSALPTRRFPTVQFHLKPFETSWTACRGQPEGRMNWLISQVDCLMFQTLRLMEEIWLTSCYGKYPIIYRVLYIPGVVGFLPSVGVQSPCQRMIGVSNHLQNA